MDEDSSTQQKTWRQACSFGKRNVFRLHLNESREDFCPGEGRGCKIKKFFFFFFKSETETRFFPSTHGTGQNNRFIFHSWRKSELTDSLVRSWSRSEFRVNFFFTYEVSQNQKCENQTKQGRIRRFLFHSCNWSELKVLFFTHKVGQN